jgi:uncharacterized protein (DUF2336 family)
VSAVFEEREDGQWVVLDGKGDVLATYAHANTAAQHAQQHNAREAALSLGTHGLHKRVEQNDHRQGCVCNRGVMLPGDEDLVCPIHGKVYG